MLWCNTKNVAFLQHYKFRLLQVRNIFQIILRIVFSHFTRIAPFKSWESNPSGTEPDLAYLKSAA
jgi:hypothetical protein